MARVKLSPKTFLYPMPTVLVGANVNGKANFVTIAYCGIVQHRPPMIGIASGKTHHTNPGIRENGTFSVNLPSTEMVKAVDYCGLVSGKSTDKSDIFEVFYGDLGTAPMIAECPLCLECRVADTMDIEGVDEYFIGEIVGAYAREECLTDGMPDIRKLDPIIFSMHENTYWKIGEKIGKAWSIGKDFRK